MDWIWFSSDRSIGFQRIGIWLISACFFGGYWFVRYLIQILESIPARGNFFDYWLQTVDFRENSFDK
jgi:hypothetical protein